MQSVSAVEEELGAGEADHSHHSKDSRRFLACKKNKTLGGVPKGTLNSRPQRGRPTLAFTSAQSMAGWKDTVAFDTDPHNRDLKFVEISHASVTAALPPFVMPALQGCHTLERLLPPDSE